MSFGKGNNLPGRNSQTVRLTVFKEGAPVHPDYKFPCETFDFVPYTMMYDTKVHGWVVIGERVATKKSCRVKMEDVIDWNRCPHDDPGDTEQPKRPGRPGRAPSLYKG